MTRYAKNLGGLAPGYA